MDAVSSETRDRITIVRLSRPAVRNAVDGATAQALARAFRDFDANPRQRCRHPPWGVRYLLRRRGSQGGGRGGGQQPAGA